MLPLKEESETWGSSVPTEGVRRKPLAFGPRGMVENGCVRGKVEESEWPRWGLAVKDTHSRWWEGATRK